MSTTTLSVCPVPTINLLSFIPLFQS